MLHRTSIALLLALGAAVAAAAAEREAGAVPSRTAAWDAMVAVRGPVGSALAAALHRAGLGA